jgi:hypothetical protein
MVLSLDPGLRRGGIGVPGLRRLEFRTDPERDPSKQSPGGCEDVKSSGG